MGKNGLNKEKKKNKQKTKIDDLYKKKTIKKTKVNESPLFCKYVIDRSLI